MTTADRPRSLRRCISSLIQQLDTRGNRARIIVVDGSRNIKNESRGRSVVSSILNSTGQDISFIGRREVRAVRRALRDICDKRLLDFALRPGASGNRNVILLLSRGENVLLVDDDVVCDVWTLRSLRNGIDVCGHTEERAIAFYRARADVCNGMVPATVNLLSAHETVLGQTVKALAAGTTFAVDTSRACRHLREAARGQRTARVRMTFSGVAGDSGVSYPDRLLFSTGSWKDVLESSHSTFTTALKFREVCKVADRYLVMHAASCMAGCMGLANTSLVPPFLPTGRNEDGLFGAMLSAIDRTTVSGHVPYAILHDSARPPRYPAGRFPSACETRSADLLISLINAWGPSIRGTEPRRRLVRLGDWLRDLTSLKKPEFVSAMSVAILRTRERELMLIETALEPDSSCPRHWQRAFRSYGSTLLKNLENPEFLLPIEFHGARSLGAGYGDLQRFVRSAAELLKVWPTLWSRAREGVE